MTATQQCAKCGSPLTPCRCQKREADKTAKQQKFERHFHSLDRVAWVKTLPCIVPGCDRRNIDNAHARSRRAGGTYKDVFPACHDHHMEQETGGIRTFEEKHGVDCVEAARNTQALWETRSWKNRTDPLIL